MYDRGGVAWLTGHVGRARVLRQTILRPGETLEVDVQGMVHFEALRERDTVRSKVKLLTFMSPLRWMWKDFPKYLNEGPSSARTIPTHANAQLSSLGIGSLTSNDVDTVPTWFHGHPVRCYNYWLKWPEEENLLQWPRDGAILVPEDAIWSRIRRDSNITNSADYEQVVTDGKFDLRKLKDLEGRFRSAVGKEHIAYGKYIEVVKSIFGDHVDASREVDEVPMLIDMTSLQSSGHERAATDGPSLGQFTSQFDFPISHRIGSITTDEHAIVTYMLCIRYPSITSGDASYHAIQPLTGRDAYSTLVGDPRLYEALEMQPVRADDLFSDGSDTVLGVLPPNYPWTSMWNCVDPRIAQRESFPIYRSSPANYFDTKNATRVYDAFKSRTFGDWRAILYFRERSHAFIPDSTEEIFAGMAPKDVRGDRAVHVPLVK